MGVAAAIDWDAVDLVVFDVDGTLYDQRRLRRRMMLELGIDCWRSRSLRTIRTLAAFRRCREELSRTRADEDFTLLQYRLTGERRHLHAAEVRAMVREWMEDRPVAFLAACRFEGIAELFAAIGRRGKAVAIWSDYPAMRKLEALGLSAGIVVASEEERRLKPDPAGLRRILAESGVPAARTLLIGDRPEHDGEAGRRAGVRVLLKRRAPHPAFPTFSSYRDPVFRPLLEATL